ncbi:unnamed protein product [Owenia fusiformis]|uniref:RNase NYN domain-containing protein n=1 Tax=Owenia fusiformis TaxID=6347 RepID=A0A8S4NBW4_OWEFU|nr:unnamed protein product [Owenia fusiformis]
MTDEFIVPKDTVGLIKGQRKMIQERYHVKVKDGLQAHDSEKNAHVWITLIGEENDRKEAKDYIISLCSPEQRVKMKYPKALAQIIQDPTCHERVERQSKAVIVFDESEHCAIVSGSELAVTLAMSALEEVIFNFKHMLGDEEQEETEYFNTSVASNRLDKELHKICDKNNDLDITEYSFAGDDVKAVVLEWDHYDKGKEGRVVEGTEVEDGVISNDLIILDDTLTPDISELEKTVIDNEFQVHNKDMSTPLRPPVTKPSTPRKDLVEFSLQKGYSQEEINEAWDSLADGEIRMSSFLGLLVKNSKNNKEREQKKIAQSSASGKSRQDSLREAFLTSSKVTSTGQECDQSARQDWLKDAFENSGLEDTLTEDIVDGRGGKKKAKRKRVTSDSPIRSQQANVQKKPVRKVSPVRAPKSIQDGLLNKPKSHSQQNKLPVQQNQTASQKQTLSVKPKQTSSMVNTVIHPINVASMPETVTSAQIQPQTNLNRMKGTFETVQKYNPPPSGKKNLRYIVIDGSNVAMSHGNNKVFSCRGIELCVEYFKSRGHKNITVFVPNWRKGGRNVRMPTKDGDILIKLEEAGMLTFTPSRHINGKNVVCYDDRFIIRLSVRTKGIIVSNDNYRDLINDSREYSEAIQKRLLLYSFVGDMFMPPDDPLGRNGPNLDDFLSFPERDCYQQVPCSNVTNMYSQGTSGQYNIGYHQDNTPQYYHR